MVKVFVASNRHWNQYCCTGVVDLNSDNCHKLLMTLYVFLFQRIQFFLAMILTLTQVTAGFPQPMDVLDPSEEEHLFPPLESNNGTLE